MNCLYQVFVLSFELSLHLVRHPAFLRAWLRNYIAVLGIKRLELDEVCAVYVHFLTIDAFYYLLGEHSLLKFIRYFIPDEYAFLLLIQEKGRLVSLRRHGCHVLIDYLVCGYCTTIASQYDQDVALCLQPLLQEEVTVKPVSICQEQPSFTFVY